jgi:hypothetical protein
MAYFARRRADVPAVVIAAKLRLGDVRNQSATMGEHPLLKEGEREGEAARRDTTTLQLSSLLLILRELQASGSEQRFILRAGV